MSEPRVTDQQLTTCLHPDERRIAPIWSNAMIRCDDLALDLRDARARIAELEAGWSMSELREARMPGWVSAERLRQAEQERDAARSQVALLREALRPYAEFYSDPGSPCRCSSKGKCFAHAQAQRIAGLLAATDADAQTCLATELDAARSQVTTRLEIARKHLAATDAEVQAWLAEREQRVQAEERPRRFKTDLHTPEPAG